jgi:hypothetical protein
VHVVDLDITDDASVEQAITSIVDTRRLDVVVNNAVIAYVGPSEAYTPEQVQQQFETNVFGMLRVNRAALSHMRQQGSGLLLQIGSIAGRWPCRFKGSTARRGLPWRDSPRRIAKSSLPLASTPPSLSPGTFPPAIGTKRLFGGDSERFALYRPALDVFMTPFFAENRSATPPDPQEVADAVARIIALPSGRRPLHTYRRSDSCTAPVPRGSEFGVAQATHAFFHALHLPQATLARDPARTSE